MIGLDLTTLPDLERDPNPPAERYTDSVPDKEARFLAAAPREWLEDYWYADWTWEQRWNRIDVDILQRAFSLDELTRIWVGSVIMSDLSKWFEEQHPALEKVRHSLWHHRAYDGACNHLVSSVRGLKRIAWPGGEVRLAYCSKYRGDGPAENLSGDDQIWLDNDLAALIHVGGRHVLTVGFGVGAGAVYVSQVQLREKNGNRWLYRLDGHYLDVALHMISSAFAGDVWLVDGASAVAAVRRSYGKGPCSVTEETGARITALYDRPLGSFARTADAERFEGRLYRRLERRGASARAA